MTSLYTSANLNEQLNAGVYAPLAGVQNPLITPIKDEAVSAVSQVQTLVFSGDLVALNVVNGKVGGVAIDPVTFDTDNATTLTALAVEIASFDNILSAVSDGTDTITVTTKVDTADTDLSDFVVTLGAGQVTATVTETVESVYSSNGLKAGWGVNVTSAGVVSLATDNATHVVAGSDLGLTDGTYLVADIYKEIQAIGLDLVRIDCVVRDGEVLVNGDTVTFSGGKLIKAVGGESQTFTVQYVETVGSVITARIEFK